MHPRLLLAAIVLSLPTPAHAQVTDLDVVVTLHPVPRSTPVIRLDVPPVSAADLPSSEAVVLHAAWRSARHTAGAQVDDTTRALAAALTAAGDGLSRPALLLLGHLQHEMASAAFAAAADGCTDHCPDQPDETAALATWARITGTDRIAAHALYQRAESFMDQNDDASAIPLFEELLALEGLPAELVASAAHDLGLISDGSEHDVVARTYGRCAALSVPDVSWRCALLAAHAYSFARRAPDALAALAPLLASDGPWSAEALDEAASTVALMGHGVSARLPRAFAAPVRARVLDRAASFLGQAGLFGLALEDLTAAGRLDPQTDRTATRADLEQRRDATPDTAARWVRRVARFCAAPTWIEGTLALRGRFGPHGVTGMHVDVESDPSRALAPVVTCLRHAPGPETPLGGSFTARVRFVLE